MENNETNNGGNTPQPDQSTAQSGNEEVGAGVQKGTGEGEVQSNVGSGDNRELQVAQEENQDAGTPLTLDQRKDLVEKYVAASLAENILAYNSFEIKKNFPKAYKLLETWMNETAHTGGQIDDEVIAGVLLYSPRTVTFNFFDKQNILVSIISSTTGGWHYSVDLGDGFLTNKGFKTRTETEVAAFTEAFKVLETRLNKT